MFYQHYDERVSKTLCKSIIKLLTTAPSAGSGCSLHLCSHKCIFLHKRPTVLFIIFSYQGTLVLSLSTAHFLMQTQHFWPPSVTTTWTHTAKHNDTCCLFYLLSSVNHTVLDSLFHLAFFSLLIRQRPRVQPFGQGCPTRNHPRTKPIF